MNEAKSILESIIGNFAVDKFNRFFREKSQQFVQREENYSHHNDNNFINGFKIGEINFPDIDSLLVCAFKVTKPLSERAGKKAQYEKAKNILKSTENQRFSSGIFIYYNTSGNFRFSLVYPESIGTRRQWNNFRRFTYFVDRELTNKTFKQRVGQGDFSSLERIKEAFSVEKVTKDFYKEIAYWYFWACKISQPPEGATKQENGKEMFIIRLITRIVFVWFMRQKDSLLPDILFDKERFGEILNDFSPESSTYYKAILQNLFFATLSTEVTKRKFRSEFRAKSGWNEDFGNQYVYRYYDLFQKPERIESYFEQIPFLNGGLFECLDDKDNDNYIDGFTERKKYQPIMPNFLFFGNERAVDLNSDFGTKNKSYKVRGLIDILSSYNFTIDENTPDDQDVALDPELLGRVFENLLASFNPETSTTARKATGSYYTPREIVDYMVTESLKAYFKTHLEGIENIDEKMETLFSNVSEENPFGSSETKRIVELIESVKIVDPAVGSGAFPMGALNKLVFILGKIDPGNQLWKQAQLDAAEFIPDPQVRRNTKNQIEEFFIGKNADYGRKLYLIQKCIYGVDIQQIAVEIAKLRFFISLMVDEKIEDQKENHGIEPLPNLDFKLMRGNSLIEYGSPDLIVKGKDEEKNKLIDSYFDMKEKYFFTSDHKIKKELFDNINNTIIQLANYNYQKQYDEENKRLEGFKAQSKLFGTLAGENLTFEDNRPEVKRLSKKLIEVEEKLIKSGMDHFEWHLYFNEVFEKGGFDIVIANPPYVRVHKQNKEQKEVLKRVFTSPHKDFDIYIVFIEQAMRLLKENGVLCFITPDKYLIREYGEKIRKYLFNYQLVEFYDVSRANDLFGAAVYPLITIVKKKHEKGKTKVRITDSIAHIRNPKTDYLHPQIKWEENGLIELIQAGDLDIINKIFSQSDKLKDFVEKDIFCGTPRAKDYYNWAKGLTTTSGQQRIRVLVCQNLRPYKIDHSLLVRTLGEKIKSPFFDNSTKLISHDRWNDFQSNPKILIRGNDTRITAVIDNESSVFIGIYAIKFSGENKRKYIKYTLALLNSNLYQWIFLKQNPSLKIGGSYFSINASQILRLPFKQPPDEIFKQFDIIIDELLSKIYSDNFHIEQYQKQIDQLVYKLYGLTQEEIAIVEGKQ